MNIYAGIILWTLLVSYGVELIADMLNLRALNPNVPAEFQDVYDAEAYRKSQEYTRVNTRFGVMSSTFHLLVTLLFWFSGGFNWLDQIVRGWGLHPILTGLFYIGILVFVKIVLSLPFSIYDTFVIEERFGFNTTTPRTFIIDLLKSLGLAIIIGGPLLAGVLAFFEYAGAYAWLYCWIVTTIVMLFLQLIAPTWILPLFNKFTPLEAGELREKIFAYADSVNFPLDNIFVMDGSKRSTKSNAFFTGFGKRKRIALFDTLIEGHTIPELVAVLAHEIGHYKKKHVLQHTIINILHAGVMFYLLSIFLSHEGLFDAFYMEQTSIYAGLIFFGMLYTPIELILSVVLQLFSRKHEYEADRFAAQTTQPPDAMIDSLKQLSVHNLSNLTPHPFYVFLHYSHPPMLERVRAIRQMHYPSGAH
ncbi:M48 family metalloprotease [candidate division KSB3 bacterium]|uniref:M48 family metalloprotease n=1 Tax=candidate division KSB3 bacterium TaxID=2044937 RepID=A0A9D5JSK8_9BACT|nr:M48 family metalloprotease [candidate division KSB3 bacterium]MBD3323350.1 M48 family metalloprotease [candidate division KSB3 bacterium]